VRFCQAILLVAGIDGGERAAILGAHWWSHRLAKPAQDAALRPVGGGDVEKAGGAG